MTEIAERLAAILPAAALRAVTPSYLEEPRGRWQGQAAAIVAPGSVAEVAAVLRLCSELRAPVIPYGGGTGLVGGQLAEAGAPPVILSLERMRRVRSFDAEAGTMIVEAGAILPRSMPRPRPRRGFSR
jgi:FAD/FMN-containing dehydrogenase